MVAGATAREGPSLLAVEPREKTAVGAERDQRVEAAQPRLVLLRAHHVPGGEMAVPGWPRLEESPGLRARAEAALERARESRVRARDRVGARRLLVALLERGATRRAHSSGRLELAYALHVDDAPHRAGLARGEALHVPALVHALAHAVDPSEAERLVQRFPVGDPRLARSLVEEADPELGNVVVVLPEPGAHLARIAEVPRRRRAASARAHAWYTRSSRSVSASRSN